MIVYHSPNQCPQCGHKISQRYSNLSDAIYGVPGAWQINQCTNEKCQVLFLGHDLTSEDITSFYTEYSTHAPRSKASSYFKTIYRELIEECWHRNYNYDAPARRRKILGYVFNAIPYFGDVVGRRVFWLEHREQGQLIEVGFGNAETLMRMRDLGWQVSGVEYDAQCVAQAKGVDLDVIYGSLHDLNATDTSIDAIVASHTIEHVPDPIKFFSEAYRILSPNGNLVLSTPNGLSLGARLFNQYWRGLEVPRHLAIQNARSLYKLAKDNGFREIEIFGTYHSGFILQQSFERKFGLKISRKQNWVTLFFNVAGVVIALMNRTWSDEIVLKCKK